MEEITIYEKPTCSKCRAAGALLDAQGKPFRRVRYYEHPLSAEKLEDLFKKSDVPVREFVRTTDPAFKALKRNVSSFTNKELALLLSQNLDLIQRPILERGNKATIGRPTERAAAFILGE